MMHRFDTILLAGLGLMLSAPAFADSDDKGSLSASFETNTTYYMNDEATGAVAPDGRFGSPRAASPQASSSRDTCPL